MPEDHGRSPDERAAILDDLMRLEHELISMTVPDEAVVMAEADLTLQQVRTMMFVRQCGTAAPISTVATHIGVKPNVATGIIQRLVRRGLLVRTEDPDDRRVRRIETTDAGERLLADLTDGIRRQRAWVYRRLDDEQLRQLRAIYTVMVREGPST
ncbi:MAG: MarR family transcriptional regulator [Chloroflexi bacterium]|nr:MarR family transcriptional regulator [Chloroflexota bacterium]